MSKMGISTYQSYCGAQIFDAVGLSSALIEKYFTGTASVIEGVGLAEIAGEAVRRHRDAYGDNPIYATMLDVGGQYAWRLRGESPRLDTRVGLQPAARRARQPARGLQDLRPDDQRASPNACLTLRGLMRLKPGRRRSDPDRGRRACGRARQALLHRRHELRLDQPRGAHDAGHRHEPYRRPLEYGRGRRGERPLQAAPERRLPCARPSSRWPRVALA